MNIPPDVIFGLVGLTTGLMVLMVGCFKTIIIIKNEIEGYPRLQQQSKFNTKISRFDNSKVKNLITRSGKNKHKNWLLPK
jgi:hypothetical protein